MMKEKNIREMARRMNLVTIDDMCRYSIPQLVVMIANKLNELADEVWRFETDVQETLKTQNENIQYLLGEGLHLEVENIFDGWVQDGTFDSLINQTALKKVSERIDETNADFSNILTKFNQTKNFKGFTAHRGFNSLAPENTLKSISKAIELGFVVCEIDIQKTKDGQWVLMHDYTVDATTNGSGNVKEMTLEEIKELKVDTPTQLIDSEEVIRVPTFEEVVKLCAKHQIGLNIDGGDPLKFSFTEENVNYVVDMLDKYNLTAKSWIICKTKADREFVHNLKPHMRVGWVSEPSNVNDDINEAKKYKLNAIVGYNSNTVTEDVVTKCQKNGVELLLFGANTNEVAYKSINMGVSYIETDKIIPGGVM